MEALPLSLLILGLLIILLDMMVTAFITPIGVAFATLGILLGFGLGFTESFVLSLIASVIAYFLVGHYIRRDIRDIGAEKKKYTFELKGKRGRVVEIGKEHYIVELDGDKWIAIPEDGELRVNDTVEVVDVDGVKLIVRKV
ncbi:NfeD family protein [Thermococcus sp.]|uniref:NfeD family protein n=1 Tax=Thermococcus sp. TaxID=35749 RepID=UPI00262557DF|nr:NfeD family protein [Thermococcus sp.]